ncbi:MAG: Maf family nucleotide pyrophosphatase [Flavobacteriales bacterium]|nr:Maf family nucleotide pyrophosphatase [Flavobacteriales bacterium]
MIKLPYQIILGSQSPRRQALLSGLDIPFQVMVKDTDESYPDDLLPCDVAIYLSRKKSDAFKQELAEHPDWLIITADTLVSIQGVILNKPSNFEEAFHMLSMLSGSKHTVYTGVSIRTAEKHIVFSEETHVYFDTLRADEIQYYLEKYKPFDKAGSYGVQEWIGYIGIRRMEGCYYNVMGLPVNKLYHALKNF